MAFFNYVYNEMRRELGRSTYGNRQGTNDGYDYRGRGFNQLTFRGSYERYSSESGVDIVSNPDLLNNIDVAAKIGVKFIANRLRQKFGTSNPDFSSLDQAIQEVAHANSGLGKDRESRSVQRSIANARLAARQFS